MIITHPDSAYLKNIYPSGFHSLFISIRIYTVLESISKTVIFPRIVVGDSIHASSRDSRGGSPIALSVLHTLCAQAVKRKKGAEVG